MATNKPYGDNARKGSVKKRTQLKPKKALHFLKRNLESGTFMDIKADKRKFKGVVKEK